MLGKPRSFVVVGRPGLAGLSTRSLHAVPECRTVCWKGATRMVCALLTLLQSISSMIFMHYKGYMISHYQYQHHCYYVTQQYVTTTVMNTINNTTLAILCNICYEYIVLCIYYFFLLVSFFSFFHIFIITHSIANICTLQILTSKAS